MSTKLSNGIEYFNPNFPAEFAEFLLANHFICKQDKGSLGFRNGDVLLTVVNDQVDLFIYHPEQDGQEAEKWVFSQNHSGLSQLNLFGWILLMHIMDVLKISDFMRNAKRVSMQEATEANFLINNVFTGPLKKVG